VDNSGQHAVLIVDDDRSVVEALTLNLELAGYLPTAAFDKASALRWLKHGAFDLVLLDVIGTNGLEVLRELRSSDSHVPVVMLSQLTDSADHTLALAAGADAYIDKPFDRLELLAVIEAVLRRTDRTLDLATMPRLLTADGTLLLNRLPSSDLGPRSAYLEGAQLDLPAKHLDMLEYLMLRSGEIATRQEIERAVWGGDPDAAPKRRIHQAVESLRGKLGDPADAPRFIKNEYAQGYRFKQSVRAVT
jgi:DNA-binding response OmpR family regulator